MSVWYTKVYNSFLYFVVQLPYLILSTATYIGNKGIYIMVSLSKKREHAVDQKSDFWNTLKASSKICCISLEIWEDIVIYRSDFR